MHKHQATGLDTRGMLPVYAGLFCVLCQWLLPWISLPVLKYSKLPTTYRLSQMEQCLQSIQLCTEAGGKLKLSPLAASEIEAINHIFSWVWMAAILVSAVLALGACAVLLKREKSQKLLCIGFSLHTVLTLTQLGFGLAGNLWLNRRMGRPSTFINLSLHSYIQLTSWVYAQLLISVAMLMLLPRLYSVKEAPLGESALSARRVRPDHRLGRRTAAAALLMLTAIPLVILFGVFFLNDRSNVFIGLCIICLAILPFAMIFEARRPQARELLVIAVMAGIAVAGRMAFFMLPQFKPVCAVVIIAGAALGPEAGFLTGAISAFASNFFFGQGPWTPWQMFAYGIIGFLAGLLFYRRQQGGGPAWPGRCAAQCVYGGLASVMIYGFIMDVSSVLDFSGSISWEMLRLKLLSGLPFNLIHGVSTVVFLWLLAAPMEQKLDRIRKKYGLLEA